MAGFKGSALALTWGGTAILGCRQKGISVAGAPIDVTSDEDAGWRTLLTVSGQDEVNISISGVTKDDVLKTDFFAGTRTKALVVTYPGVGGKNITGQFYLASYKDTGPYKDATTFEAEFQSSGAVTFAAP